MRFADRGGFTLLEVMVALAISGLLLLGARALLVQVGDAAEEIAGTAAGVDREANAERLLRALVGRVEPPRPESEFVGTPRGVRFATWCDVPAGWLERCSVSLGILQAGDGHVLALQAEGGEVVALRRGFAAGHLLYLQDPAGGGMWRRGWSSSVTAPVAIGVVMDGDTTILRVGEHG
ncbi:MAG TPA: prepilin-type N-terminal cleavage/methylation domain-containing protein [Longimicrobium sp.]